MVGLVRGWCRVGDIERATRILQTLEREGEETAAGIALGEIAVAEAKVGEFGKGLSLMQQGACVRVCVLSLSVCSLPTRGVCLSVCLSVCF